jgi:hypothetical protein
MSVIASSSMAYNDEDLILDQKTWDKIKSFEDAEEIEKYLPKNLPNLDEEDENMDPLERRYRFFTDGGFDKNA